MQTHEMTCVEFVDAKGINIEGVDLQKAWPDERLPHKILCNPASVLAGCKLVQSQFRDSSTELVQSEAVDKRYLVCHYGPPPTKEQIEKKVAERKAAEAEARKAEK